MSVPRRIRPRITAAEELVHGRHGLADVGDVALGTLRAAAGRAQLVGHLVGSLSADEGKAFALDCHTYVDGHFTARCDDTGRVRLVAA